MKIDIDIVGQWKVSLGWKRIVSIMAGVLAVIGVAASGGYAVGHTDSSSPPPTCICETETDVIDSNDGLQVP